MHCIHYTCTLACMHTCKQTSDITAPGWAAPNQPNTSPSHSFSIYLQILNENQFTYLPSYPPTCLRTYAPSYLLTTHLSICLFGYLFIHRSIDTLCHCITLGWRQLAVWQKTNKMIKRNFANLGWRRSRGSLRLILDPRPASLQSQWLTDFLRLARG